jgi:hypothetical protein
VTRLSERATRWLLAFACCGLLTFFFSPPFGAFALWARVPQMGSLMEVRRGASVLAQVAHPGAPIADPLHAVIQWRVLFPLIGHALTWIGLPAGTVFGFSGLGCLAVTALLIGIFRRRGLGWDVTVAATLILSAGSWWFASVCWLGYFDAWTVFGLLAVGFAEPVWAVWMACALGGWVDERFVLGAAVALLCRRIDGRSKGIGIAVLILGAFVLVRLGVLHAKSATGATAAGYWAAQHLEASFGRVLLGIWEGLRVGWLLVAAALWRLWRNGKPGWTAALGITVVALVTLGRLSAQDFGRSMEILWPVGVLGALMLADRTIGHAAGTPTASGATRSPFWGLAAAAALLLPGHLVMSDRVSPVFYLYSELAAIDHPPAGASPELYELSGIRAMERGDLGRANADLTLAIQLAKNPAGPAQQRGVLYASHGRWAEAQRDFSLVVLHEPANPEGWFLRAQADRALNQPGAALADFEHALSVGGASFAEQDDVRRFRAKLAAH